MENLNPWLLLLAGLLVGALVGGLIILFMERRNRGSDSDVRAARRELETYRQEVADHYVETAKRVNALTHSYKSVYDHLEDGAYRLVGENELRRRLDDATAEPVMLEGIGQRSLTRPQDEYEEMGASDRADADPAPLDADREAEPPPPGPRPVAVPPPPPPASAGTPSDRTAADVDAGEQTVPPRGDPMLNPDEEEAAARSDADAVDEARRS